MGSYFPGGKLIQGRLGPVHCQGVVETRDGLHMCVTLPLRQVLALQKPGEVTAHSGDWTLGGCKGKDQWLSGSPGGKRVMQSAFSA